MTKPLIPILAASVIALSLPLGGHAQTAPEASAGAGHSHGQAAPAGTHRGAHAGAHAGHRHGAASPMGTGSGLAALSLQAWLHGLGLTEAQRDKVFEIVHAQAPGLRQQAKAVRAARGELGALSTAATLDSAQLKAASDKLARALADMSESRVRTRNQIFQILTPEQQKQVEAKLAQYDRKHGGHEGHMRPGGHHGHGHGMRPGHGPGRAPGAEATPAQQG